MELSEFASAWCYNPEKPQFANYPTVLDHKGLPDLEASLKTIGEYQRRLWANQKKAVLVVVHGPDTSGKDSLIRTLSTWADPAGFHAWSFSRPRGEEVKHDFLWRVVPYLPAAGQMVAFNRSHHEAVIAERVWPVHAPESYDWQSRYRSIREFERHLVSEGTVLLKVWLNLSEAEHRKRLLKRLDKPRKRWKFDRSDIDGWARRKDYQACAEQALSETHTKDAPWFMIPGDSKPSARAIIAALLAEQLEHLAPDYPSEDPKVLADYRQLLARHGIA